MQYGDDGLDADTAAKIKVILDPAADDLVEGVPYWFDEDTFMLSWDDLPQTAKDDLANIVVSGDLDVDDALAIISEHATPEWYDEAAAGLSWDDLPMSAKQDAAGLAELVIEGAIDADEAMATLVDDIAGAGPALEKLPHKPNWFDEAEWGKWDDLAAQQQHDIVDAAWDTPTPGKEGTDGAIRRVLGPAPDPDEIVATFDAFVTAPDPGLQSVLHHVVGSGGDDAFQFLDEMIDTVPATPGTKNVPKKLKIKRRLDELADMVGEEPLDAVAHNYLNEIALPPGMKNFNDKGFVDARWRLRKDFVAKGYLTQEEGDALADALDAIRKRVAAGNADGLFTGDALQGLADDLIKLNQTLASRVKANTLANGTKPPGGSLLKKFMESQEAFNDNFGAKVLDLAEDAKSSWDDFLPTNGQFVNDLGNPIPPHLLSQARSPSAVCIPKPKKPPAGYTIPEAKPLPGIKRPSQPADLPFTPGRLVEDKALGKQLSGQHPKQVYKDPDTGRMWIFKPQDKWQSELDRATSELQRRLGLQGAETHVVTLNGQVGSIQEVIGGSFDDTVSIFAGKTFDPTKLSAAQMERMQQNQLLDFLFSNYDSHSDNFLRLRQAAAAALLPIGIDKGQAFKHFGKTGEPDGLVNWLFNPNSNAPAKNPYGVMLEKFAAGEKVAYQWADESQEIQKLIASAKELADSGELEKILKPYIDEAAAAGRLPAGYDADKMLAEVVDRWKNLGDDVKRLDEKLLKTKGGAIRTAEQQARAAADAAAAALEERVAELGMKAPSAFKKTTSAWANKVLKPITMKLSETSRRAVQRYTGSYYSKVNNALRGRGSAGATGGKGKINTALNATDRKAIAAIDNAMAPLEDDIIVWRGTGDISLPDGTIIDAKNLEGTILGDYGFQSASVGDSPAFGGTYKLKISVQKGVRAVYANPSSSHKGARELLLQRGLRMYVRGVEKEGSRYVLDVVAIPDSAVIPGVTEAMKLPVYKQMEEAWRSLVTA